MASEIGKEKFAEEMRQNGATARAQGRTKTEERADRIST